MAAARFHSECDLPERPGEHHYNLPLHAFWDPFDDKMVASFRRVFDWHKTVTSIIWPDACSIGLVPTFPSGLPRRDEQLVGYQPPTTHAWLSVGLVPAGATTGPPFHHKDSPARRVSNAAVVSSSMKMVRAGRLAAQTLLPPGQARRRAGARWLQPR